METENNKQFITRYKSHEDRSKPHRVLDTVKVGNIYVSRLELEHGAVAGNTFHKETNVILFVTKGVVRMRFADIETGATEELDVKPGFGIIHQPPKSALAAKNISMGKATIVFFSNRRLRSGDDYEYILYDPFNGTPIDIEYTAKVPPKQKPMTHYPLRHDRTKPGRLLEVVKVGDVHISRLTIDPGVVTGNMYHKDTSVILFVIKGRLKFKFVQTQTKEEKEFVKQVGSGITYMPPYVAMADKNISDEPAIVILFSNKPLRSGDDFEYKVYPTRD